MAPIAALLLFLSLHPAAALIARLGETAEAEGVPKWMQKAASYVKEHKAVWSQLEGAQEVLEKNLNGKVANLKIGDEKLADVLDDFSWNGKPVYSSLNKAISDGFQVVKDTVEEVGTVVDDTVDTASKGLAQVQEAAEKATAEQPPQAASLVGTGRGSIPGLKGWWREHGQDVLKTMSDLTFDDHTLLDYAEAAEKKLGPEAAAYLDGIPTGGKQTLADRVGPLVIDGHSVLDSLHTIVQDAVAPIDHKFEKVATRAKEMVAQEEEERALQVSIDKEREEQKAIDDIVPDIDPETLEEKGTVEIDPDDIVEDIDPETGEERGTVGNA